MKHEVGWRVGPPPHFWVLTRIDLVCKNLLEDVAASTPDTDWKRLQAIVATYVYGATFIECLTNFLLRRCITQAFPYELLQRKLDSVFFDALERLSTERKIEVLRQLKGPSVQVDDSIGQLKVLIDRRNFIIHYKAKPDTLTPEEVGITSIQEWQELTVQKMWTFPNQAWVTQLLAEDRASVAKRFIDIGTALENAFDIQLNLPSEADANAALKGLVQQISG